MYKIVKPIDLFGLDNLVSDLVWIQTSWYVRTWVWQHFLSRSTLIWGKKTATTIYRQIYKLRTY